MNELFKTTLHVVSKIGGSPAHRELGFSATLEEAEGLALDVVKNAPVHVLPQNDFYVIITPVNGKKLNVDHLIPGEKND